MNESVNDYCVIAANAANEALLLDLNVAIELCAGGQGLRS